MLDQSEGFGKLLENGVVTLMRSRDIPYGLRCSSLVGQAVLETGTRVVVREKSPGALQSLLFWSLPEDVRAIDQQSPVTSTGPVLRLFGRRFLHHLGYYLRHGRIKTYRHERNISNTPRGRIDIPATLRLRSRGLVGRIAYEKTSLTADILVNRLLSLALRHVEHLFQADQLDVESLGLARMYAPLFGDVRHDQIENWDSRAKARAFEEVTASIKIRDELQRALAYARALLLHLGAWPDRNWEIEVPDSFFLNLETLFEDAVTQVLKELMQPLSVTAGVVLRQPLFSDLKERYVANPDFVVHGPFGTTLVGDCKYKDLESHPGHSDVYQLVAHSVALNVSTAILVYPANAFVFSRLGKTSSGVNVYWAGVRIAELKADLQSAIAALERVDLSDGFESRRSE